MGSVGLVGQHSTLHRAFGQAACRQGPRQVDGPTWPGWLQTHGSSVQMKGHPWKRQGIQSCFAE